MQRVPLRTVIYLAGPIGGLTWDEATGWRNGVADMLKPMTTLSPLRPMDMGNGETVDLRDSCFVNDGARLSNESTNKEKVVLPFGKLFKRDYMDVHTCGAMFTNFLGAKVKSVGTLCEIAWAYRRAIPNVVVIDKDNVNHNPFLDPQYSAQFDNLADAVNWMREKFGWPKYEVGSVTHV